MKQIMNFLLGLVLGVVVILGYHHNVHSTENQPTASIESLASTSHNADDPMPMPTPHANKFTLNEKMYGYGHTVGLRYAAQDLSDNYVVKDDFIDGIAVGVTLGRDQFFGSALGSQAIREVVTSTDTEGNFDDAWAKLSETDKKSFSQGLVHAFKGEDPQIDEDALSRYATDLVAITQEYMDKEQNAHQQEIDMKSDINKEAGRAFLEQNATKEGVVALGDMQIKHITEGTGAAPEATSSVEVHYEGRHLDGSIFDSSIDRGQPIVFPLNGVIPGFSIGIQAMKVGGKAELYVPSHMAYGDNPPPGVLEPGETLIFLVELLSIPN